MRHKTTPMADAVVADEDFYQRWRQTLAAWYKENRRDLPWRKTIDPYKVWVSEVILQQTRIAQGTDYYKRFINRFPTVEMLAEATEEEVLRLWQGLGYYSRARNMHAAARQIAALGAFPKTYAEILMLKGVGEYTAAAVASIAFGEARAAVDGNVYRVLSRQFGITVPVDTAGGKQRFARLAATLVDKQHPGRHNQAMMDFGALQCTPKSPHCESCPFAEMCAARVEGPECFPVKSRRVKVSTRYLIYIYARARGKIFLHRRGTGDIWQGLYEPILLEFDHKAALPEITDRLPWLARHTVRLVAEGITHVLTHRRLLVDVFLVELDKDMEIEGYQSVPEEERGRYAVPRLVERIFELVENTKVE